MPTDQTFLVTTAAAAPAAHSGRKYAYLLLCGLALGLGMATATAEELSVDEMACALDPQCKAPFVDRRLRGVTATPSVRTPGSFDRTVNFAFNSADLSPAARKELDVVAESLKRPNTKSLEIVISGHTDAVGTDEYNQKLSERRAEAARDYLVSQHGIEPNRLVAKGYGKSQLLLPTEPGSELNRRVQFLNPNYSLSSASPAATTETSTPAASTSAAPTTAGDGL
jgi:outer membrane protein OmpA-like peptidoglycan-associated protein